MRGRSCDDGAPGRRALQRAAPCAPRTLHGVGNESDGAPGKAEGFVGERRSRKVSELSPFRRKRGIRRRRRRCRGGCPQPPGRRTWSGPGGVCWTVRRAAEDGGPYGDRVHFRCRGGCPQPPAKPAFHVKHRCGRWASMRYLRDFTHAAPFAGSRRIGRRGRSGRCR